MKQRKIGILFIGVVCSENLISEMIANNTGNPNLAAQKYHRLLIEGIAKNSEIFDIKVISIPEYSSFRSVKKYKEIKNDICYQYLYYHKIKILKQLINGIELIFHILQWRVKNKFSRHFIMFDALNLYSSIVASTFSMLTKIKTITTITDLPEYMYILNDKISLTDRFIYSLKNTIIKYTDRYIVLTQAIKERFKLRNGEAIIIEGLVDELPLEPLIDTKLSEVKIIHYSGGLYEKFGVKTLILAFMQIKDESIRLHLFGNGDLVNFIISCTKIDDRIIFGGYQNNKIVINDQCRSFLLVNPRYTNEDYTKYSFPSKTIEYMASGTPLLTNKLPGIPKEYFNYVYTFDNESLEGYQLTLERILQHTKSEMTAFGLKAKSFVLANKNNKKQAYKLIEILAR